MRIKLTIAYDGRPFAGWQSQTNQNGIQDHLEAALHKITGQKIRLHGAGRTDAGVHAIDQTAHFDVPEGLTLGEANWVPALNTKLPPAIRILSSEAVNSDFHSRFDATAKTYCYQITPAPILLPTLHGLTWHHPRPFSRELLENTLSHILGTHNFQAFSAKRGNETPETEYARTIFTAKIKEENASLTITLSGNGFLYKMVRLLVGTSMRVASGQLPQEQFLAALTHKPKGWQPYCAPPNGLTLQNVTYKESPKDPQKENT